MEPLSYAKTFPVRWADVDANLHMRNSAYMDYCTHVRFSYLTDVGYDPDRLSDLGMGPVVMKETLVYRREVRMNDVIQVDLWLAGTSPRAGRWAIRHHILFTDDARAAQGPAATLEIEGTWLDLRRRRPARMPADLVTALERLPRTEDYRVLGG